MTKSPPPQIKNAKIIKLPNFTSVHVNEHGEVFYLTPIGVHHIHQYNDKNLDEYTKACITTTLKMCYNNDGHLMDDETIIDHSIAEKREDLHAKAHIVNLWIQACHFIIVKSDHGRYWFLHYDPFQAKEQNNRINGMPYSRPNYSDLRPILPYNLDGVSLQDNERIQVLVIHPSTTYDINDPKNLSNGEFDAAAFSNFVGENRVDSIKTICCKDFTNTKNHPIEIDFNTKSERVTLYLQGQRDIPIHTTEKLF